MHDLAGNQATNPFVYEMVASETYNDLRYIQNYGEEERKLFLIGAAMTVAPKTTDSPMFMAKIYGAENLRDAIIRDPEFAAKAIDKLKSTILVENIARREVLSSLFIRATTEGNHEETMALLDALAKTESLLLNHINELDKKKLS